MNSKTNDYIIDILCEFFEVAIHNILRIRNLYPEGIFVQKKIYGVVLYQSVHPHLNEYISEALKAVKFHAKANQLQRFLICVTSSTTVHERYVFDVISLINNFEEDPVCLNLQQNLRDLYLKLHSASSYLEPLPNDASFKLILQTTEYSSLCLNDDSTYDNFPWLTVSEKEYKIPTAEIVPVHTIDSNSIIMQIYVEKVKK